MRSALAWRQTGYPVVAIILLMALYCLLVGSDWVGGAFAVAGVALLLILPSARSPRPRPSRGAGS